ncbi:MAG: hypothetical protein JWL61_5449 [Gemmatimonadetes bacterium]|nr:hypothetical protein [Gemmatimonadota bacterium]
MSDRARGLFGGRTVDRFVEWGNRRDGYWLIADVIRRGDVVSWTLAGDSAATERYFLANPFGGPNAMRQGPAATSRQRSEQRVYGLVSNHATDVVTLKKQFDATELPSVPIDLKTIPREGVVEKSAEERANILTLIRERAGKNAE